jgi:hypothetical protein
VAVQGSNSLHRDELNRFALHHLKGRARSSSEDSKLATDDTTSGRFGPHKAIVDTGRTREARAALPDEVTGQGRLDRSAPHPEARRELHMRSCRWHRPVGGSEDVNEPIDDDVGGRRNRAPMVAHAGRQQLGSAWRVNSGYAGVMVLQAAPSGTARCPRIEPAGARRTKVTTRPDRWSSSLPVSWSTRPWPGLW